MSGGGRADDDREDFKLIARWKAGDQVAATKLVERHSAALARFAVSSGARRDVEELVQDTFVRAFNSLDGFRGDSSFRTWLFTIERRLLLDRMRADRRRRDRVEIQEGDAITEFDALDALVADEMAGKSPRRHRRVLPTQRRGFFVRGGEGRRAQEDAGGGGATPRGAPSS